VLNSISIRSGPIAVISEQEVADITRLLRLLVTQVENSGPAGVTLRPDAALFQIATKILNASPEERASTRTALMALRDLVWRVDSVRSMLAVNGADPAIAEALNLLDTSDIHLFLRQEP
jgi:hypothetical protein